MSGFISRESTPPRGAVVAVEFPLFPTPTGADPALPLIPRGKRTLEEKAAEAANLLQALDVDVVHTELVVLNRITPATLLGGGVVERLAAAVADKQLDVVMVDAPLSPRQQRELEVELKTKVLDRTGVILDIFAARARTRAGQLQVEAALLSYQQSRLVRLWSHLERQRGGMGKTGGPGERQLELDKRLLKSRLAKVKAELRDVTQERDLQRRTRQRADVPTVALVGYTNAGKSTLFNRLVDAGTLVADALFATLDPLMRRLRLPNGLEVVLVDTVGFIADLPHELVEAFKATLEEVVMADVLLHVHDIANPEDAAQTADVMTVLEQIGAGGKPVLHVYNKVDKAPQEPVPLGGYGVSAVTGEGCNALLLAVAAKLQEGWQTLEVTLPAADGKRLAWLHAHGDVIAQRLEEETWHLVVKLRASDLSSWAQLRVE